MKFTTNYEIKALASIYVDDKWLTIQHPKGLFSARIRNIRRKNFDTPFLFTLYLTFDAESLEIAKNISDEILAQCLNILALTTGCSFVKHRIRQVVDCNGDSEMRSVLAWSENIDHDDPQPILDENFAESIERLLKYDIPPAITKAMRWYRLGINASTPDDQFQFFWFALELVANFRKTTDKVPDQCPRCKSPLYCETCKSHPSHKPYIKQAIQALIKSIVHDCDDDTIKMLSDTRNALMHGSTLREIEEKLPRPHEEVVNILGKIVFQVLIHQFPTEILKEGIIAGTPQSYVHQILTGVAHITTVVPKDSDGEFDLSFSGLSMTMMPEAPPQSARPYQIEMSEEQFKKLEKLSYRPGDHQEMLKRITKRNQLHEGVVYALVFSTDYERIKDAVLKNEPGEWQDFFRDIIPGAIQVF